MLGLALEGGGARGAYHIGAMQACMEEGLAFDAIAGTSIGAINGALLAQGDYAAARALWLKMTSADLFTEEEAHFLAMVSRGKLSVEALAYFREKARDTLSGGGVDTSRIRAIIEKYVDVGKLLKSPVDFGLVTVSVPDFKPLELFKDQMEPERIHDYIMASASFPGMEQVSIGNKRYIDGGAYDNCPINMLIDRGCDTIIAVRTLGLGIHRAPRDKTKTLITVTPSESLGPIMEFDTAVSRRNIRLGYYDALRQLRHYGGRRYYLTCGFAPAPAFQRFALVDDDSALRAARALKIAQRLPPRRLLFERLLPALIGELNLPKNAHYGDLLTAMLESRAERAELERLAVYAPADFLRKVRTLRPHPEAKGSLPRGVCDACDILIDAL